MPNAYHAYITWTICVRPVIRVWFLVFNFCKLRSFNCFLTFVSIVTNIPTYNSPVFLFNVTIIVFVIWAASCETNSFFKAITVELVVDKFFSIVWIDSKQRERKAYFNFNQSIKYILLCFVNDDMWTICKANVSVPWFFKNLAYNKSRFEVGEITDEKT